MTNAIGIDLGTTKACMAVIKDRKPVVIENSEGRRTTPSVVAFTQNAGVLIGDAAKRQAITNPANTIYSVSRLLGRKLSEVVEERRLVPYEVVADDDGDACVEVEAGGRPQRFSPPEISAMILGQLKADAEMRLGEKITQAVVTVPAHFDYLQRLATKRAARTAGIDVLRVISAPAAAALAFGLDKRKDEEIVIYDLGGGTSDVAVLQISDGVFEVKAVNGDTRLGGDDWDSRIADWILDNFKKASGLDLRKQPQALQRIREESEKAKVALSSSHVYEINLPFITSDAGSAKAIQMELTRAKLEHLCEDLIERTIAPLKDCLREAGTTAKRIDQLVLVGGMARMPKVVDTIRCLVNKSPHQGVNPVEAVAVGAAIQAGVLKGEVRDVLLEDVTSFSLGIETPAGTFTRLIRRNTTIPTRKSEFFSTVTDSQTSIEFHLLEGEHRLARDNKMLKKFLLTDIPPAPRGVPQIEVTLDVDANGILHFRAENLALSQGSEAKKAKRRGKSSGAAGPSPDNPPSPSGLDWIRQGKEKFDKKDYEGALFCFREANRLGHPGAERRIADCKRKLSPKKPVAEF